MSQNSPAKITRDSGANVKKLRNLEKDGLIECSDVLIENGRENKKIKAKHKPVGVWGHSRWGESVYASDATQYDAIRAIIGMDKCKDAMQLEAHLRSGNEYFVTEDNDFLGRRKELEAEFRCKIVTPDELENLVRGSRN